MFKYEEKPPQGQVTPGEESGGTTADGTATAETAGTEASTGNDSVSKEAALDEEDPILAAEAEALLQEFENISDALDEEDDTTEEELNEAANLLEEMAIAEVIIETTPEEEAALDEAAEGIDEPKIEPVALPNQIKFSPQLR